MAGMSSLGQEILLCFTQGKTKCCKYNTAAMPRVRRRGRKINIWLSFKKKHRLHQGLNFWYSRKNTLTHLIAQP
jgi:hypothetical protein